MSWESAMNDLANSWKVGIAFVVLVAIRVFLTSRAESLAHMRAALFGGIASLFGGDRPATPPNPMPSDVDSGGADAATGNGNLEAPALRSRAEEMRSSLLEFIDSGLIALVLVFMIIRPFIIQAFYIPSGSMRPTLVENDKILVSKFAYRFHPLRRSDVIVFKAPPEAALDEKDFIKRLIALPGDVVEVRDGMVFINGQPLHEPYIAEPPVYDMPPVTVEPGKVFVMGDNRNDSNDSHAWGQLDADRIRGKALVIFWPLSRIGVIR